MSLLCDSAAPERQGEASLSTSSRWQPVPGRRTWIARSRTNKGFYRSQGGVVDVLSLAMPKDKNLWAGGRWQGSLSKRYVPVPGVTRAYFPVRKSTADG